MATTYYDNFYGNLQLFFPHYHHRDFCSLNITSAYVFRFSFYVQVFASDSAIIFLLNLKISNQTKNL